MKTLEYWKNAILLEAQIPGGSFTEECVEKCESFQELDNLLGKIGFAIQNPSFWENWNKII